MRLASPTPVAILRTLRCTPRIRQSFPQSRHTRRRAARAGVRRSASASQRPLAGPLPAHTDRLGDSQSAWLEALCGAAISVSSDCRARTASAAAGFGPEQRACRRALVSHPGHAQVAYCRSRLSSARLFKILPLIARCTDCATNFARALGEQSPAISPYTRTTSALRISPGPATCRPPSRPSANSECEENQKP